MALAVGRMGMALDDFLRMTPDEFAEAAEAWHQDAEATERSAWERMRLLATITIQPHCKKRLNATQLLPLPWDKGRGGRRGGAQRGAAARAVAEARFKQLIAKQTTDNGKN